MLTRKRTTPTTIATTTTATRKCYHLSSAELSAELKKMMHRFFHLKTISDKALSSNKYIEPKGCLNEMKMLTK